MIVCALVEIQTGYSPNTSHMG